MLLHTVVFASFLRQRHIHWSIFTGRGAVPSAHRAAGGGGAPRQPGHQAPALRPHTRADQLLRVRIVQTL